MPELPDITVYVEALRRRIVGEPLVEVRLNTPFLLRSVEPPLSDLIGKHVRGVERSGKRIVIELDDDYFIVLHLMIAGRLHWKARGAKGKGRADLAAFEFPAGTLSLTEAGTKRRASIWCTVRPVLPSSRAADSRCSIRPWRNSPSGCGRRATR
jgi:formamidopyrimidine-DNA glycosylase